MSSEVFNWPDAPLDIKRLVVKRMDYISRLNLKTCSKDSKHLTDTNPYIYQKMELKHEEQWKHVKLIHDVGTEYYIDANDSTVVYNGNTVTMVHDSNYLDVAQQHLNEYIEKQRNSIDTLVLRMNTTFPDLTATKIRTLRIHCFDLSPEHLPTLQTFLNNITSLSHVCISTSAYIQYFNALSIAKTIYIPSCPLFDDQQLMNINAKLFDIFTYQITDQGICQFLKQKMTRSEKCKFQIRRSITNKEAILRCFRVEDLNDNMYILSLTDSDMKCVVIIEVDMYVRAEIIDKDDETTFKIGSDFMSLDDVQ